VSSNAGSWSGCFAVAVPWRVRFDPGVPKAVHRICPACLEPTEGADVDPDAGLLRCDRCGAATPFDLLPPLLFLTGASGAGKTTLYRALVGKVREALLIDADLLWGVDARHDDRATGYRRFRGLVLHLAERLAANGTPVLIEGSCMPEQYEALGERWYFTKTAYLAVVCSDDELRRRLEVRPSWRDSKFRLEPMLVWNRQLRTRNLPGPPVIDVVDTTGRPVSECAAEVHAWIRRQVT
jgi:chloramphenicol 3-O-phosphotransferase